MRVGHDIGNLAPSPVGPVCTRNNYAARGFEQIAQLYLRDARRCYMTWGADGKVRQLDQRHPHLGKDEPARGPMGTITAPVEHLDLATVLRVSRSVAGELVLEQLVEMLLRTALEHAGAERSLLVLPRGGELSIHAQANTSGNAVMVRLREAPTSAAELPESAIRYAARTQESVILDDASAGNPLASMIRDARRAAEVVAHVRGLLKKSDVDRTPLDLGQVIRDVLVLVQPAVARHRILLRTSLPDDLPPVLGDRIQLQQVLLNLVTNAIEAMRDVADRSRELMVSAHRHEVGAGVRVVVEDTGVGFERANVERLFQALYTTRPDGSGIGLSISRSTILSHGGRLWAMPNASYGATFQFIVPAWKGQRP
jgi:signal transduction histidine kinase